MKIAILGAGFTGLSAALKLAQAGHQVTVFESEPQVGGLAGGFKYPSWEWTLEKFYHHWFLSDKFVHNMALELHQQVLNITPETNIYIKSRILPIDSPASLLRFPYLSMVDKLRTSAVLAFLKLSSTEKPFEGKLALPWIKKWMGRGATKIIWDPLFEGKFGNLKNEVTLPWFWGRIKKRSKTLCYPEGGIAGFAQKIAGAVEKAGGKILLNSEVTSLRQKANSLQLTAYGSKRSAVSGQLVFDKVIVTLPTPVFTKITPSLPKAYVKKISSIPHLTAQNLILVLEKPFLKGSYWLNINKPGFPFLLLAEHTNFMDPKHYGGDHILYIGNYLPDGHPYLKMSAKELLKIYDPFLKRINPSYQLSAVSCQLFTQPFAQPVITPSYLKNVPGMATPLKNVYLANMDMIYPWDRETNYAIELGEKVAEFVANKNF